MISLAAFIITVVILIAAAVIAGFISFRFGFIYRQKIAEAHIGSAEIEARKVVEDSKKAAEAKKREILLEAKEEAHKIKNESEKEIKERRHEVAQQEKRIQHKEENFDKKIENLESKEENLNKKIKEAEASNQKIKETIKQQNELLEKISNFTTEQAKEYLLSKIKNEVKHEAAVMIKEMEAKARETAENKGKEIVSLAIQKCAAEHVVETTVSVVPLPNDEMKGRIIGREGRNIRTLETLTGIDLIIDDTPEAVILSGFDPIRREVARISLEKLILDGRIHPARIEETVERSKKEVENNIRLDGERAAFETGIHSLHPELIKLLGRLRFRTSYGQNVLNHSVEVAYLAGVMANEIGIDAQLAKRAGLLHDIGKAVSNEIEGSHVSIGVDLVKKYKENNDVAHAIMAHHGDVEATTVVACLVQAADAISAARPGARRESLENYMKRLEKLEKIANSFEGVEKCFAIQAGREIRIMVKPEIVNDETCVLISKEIVKQIENELEYPGQIKVNVIRELRSISYAR